ncbi:MAG: hypothetical protein HW421_1108 [Ignavibacteria bacterium]|nr:hypothetical protein [Ignavibacteria bacterium]
MEAEVKNTKVIKTGQFGELEVNTEHIFRFDNGILGFEDLREFVLISDEDTAPFKWLLSIEQPEIGFPLLSPWFIDLTYEPGRFFDVNKNVIFVVITLADAGGLMTANLKAPILLDVPEQVGQQVILPSDRYSPNYVIQKK